MVSSVTLLNVSELFQYPESANTQSQSELRQADTGAPHDMDLNGLFDMDDKNLSGSLILHEVISVLKLNTNITIAIASLIIS